jgi:hypothetical protein
VFAALAKSASDPDHRHNPDRKVYLEMTGDYTPRQQVDVRQADASDLSQMSDAELDRLARQVGGGQRSAVSGQPEGEGAE